MESYHTCFEQYLDKYILLVPSASLGYRGIDRQRSLLVQVGRLAFEKNRDFLLRMLVRIKAAIPDILFVITDAEQLRAEALRQPASRRSSCGTVSLRPECNGLEPLEADPEPNRSPS
ncbi:hypothetical protein [Halochromatium roseum]|uniref:hypothetical protein n=1 Tax=Halochromatium roseum TaxID=391920 RepID=UPI0019141D0C|nr:hypothetical protein [Halochromatium roseum]MBK5939579.1 hypothetical protein [Halochromatium roseum]